ncbi:hypothetical protein KAR91_09215 [Candidatus Pacearchaeota archaeon]|nr:hypothetical protein [Candidatus Pacearchaeota archaeon]
MKHIYGIILLGFFCYGGYLIWTNFDWKMCAGVVIMVVSSVVGKVVEET